jgi:exodeoxyribonuclease VII large subunit
MFRDFYPEEWGDDDDPQAQLTEDSAEGLLGNAAYSVQDITEYIADLFNQDTNLRSVTVQGEVSNMTAARSGHWYFTIKDAHASLRCVMFKNATQYQTTQPEEGDAVVVTGSIRVYVNRGEYQLYAEHIQPVGGVGELYRRFEELKQKMDAEGLFDPFRKRPLPKLPHTIGIVTSANAAALQDMRHVIERRYPQANIILSPTLVQGATAPPQIVRALHRLYEYDPVPDVIIVARGGGSIEDLWAFNDEDVARAIVASPVPVISGVGHETDFTIVDFVADERAPTPSAAAERVTPDQDELRQDLYAIQLYLTRQLHERLVERQTNLSYLRKSLYYQSPRQRIDDARQQSDEWLLRIQQAQKRQHERLQERLESRHQALIANSPQSILARGYAIVERRADGGIVRHRDDAPAGTAIIIRTHQETLHARTEDEENNDRYNRTLF